MGKKTQGPRRKRMDRNARMESAIATKWVEKYEGKNIIRGYCKWYAVDRLCAIIELRELGMTIPAEVESECRKALLAQERKSRQRKIEKKQVEEDEWPECDETFAYIAGYTPGGMPFGVTWEEVEGEPPWISEEDQCQK